jgi:hypothetical protein
MAKIIIIILLSQIVMLLTCETRHPQTINMVRLLIDSGDRICHEKGRQYYKSGLISHYMGSFDVDTGRCVVARVMSEFLMLLL